LELTQLKNKLLAASYTVEGTDIRTLFKRADTDHSGYLDMNEISRMVKRLLPKITDWQLRHLVESLDSDGNGTVEEDELVAFLTSPSPQHSPGGLKPASDQCDTRRTSGHRRNVFLSSDDLSSIRNTSYRTSDDSEASMVRSEVQASAFKIAKAARRWSKQSSAYQHTESSKRAEEINLRVYRGEDSGYHQNESLISRGYVFNLNTDDKTSFYKNSFLILAFCTVQFCECHEEQNRSLVLPYCILPQETPYC